MVHAIMPGRSRELDVAKPVGGKTCLVRSVDGDEVGVGAWNDLLVGCLYEYLSQITFAL